MTGALTATTAHRHTGNHPEVGLSGKDCWLQRRFHFKYYKVYLFDGINIDLKNEMSRAFYFFVKKVWGN